MTEVWTKDAKEVIKKIYYLNENKFNTFFGILLLMLLAFDSVNYWLINFLPCLSLTFISIKLYVTHLTEKTKEKAVLKTELTKSDQVGMNAQLGKILNRSTNEKMMALIKEWFSNIAILLVGYVSVFITDNFLFNFIINIPLINLLPIKFIVDLFLTFCKLVLYIQYCQFFTDFLKTFDDDKFLTEENKIENNKSFSFLDIQFVNFVVSNNYILNSVCIKMVLSLMGRLTKLVSKSWKSLFQIIDEINSNGTKELMKNYYEKTKQKMNSLLNNVISLISSIIIALKSKKNNIQTTTTNEQQQPIIDVSTNFQQEVVPKSSLDEISDDDEQTIPNNIEQTNN